MLLTIKVANAVTSVFVSAELRLVLDGVELGGLVPELELLYVDCRGGRLSATVDLGAGGVGNGRTVVDGIGDLIKEVTVTRGHCG